MYFLYLLECSDKGIYTGITTDVARRFKEHKADLGGRYTRSRQAVKILHTEQFETRSAALERESEVKRWTRERKLSLVRTVTTERE